MPPQIAPAPGGGMGGGAPAPFGTSGATTPTPNLGYEAAGLQKLGSIVKQLEEMLPLFGASSDPGQAVLDAIKKLVKFVPPGSVTPAAERNQIDAMLMKNTANNQQMQALRQQRTQGQPPAAPAAMPGGPPGAAKAPAMPGMA